ncbi:MAG: endo-1,4-beta-xylanase [Oscillospiraceae bacterium]|nr:endo-1,4-beta-xylanase [Oscillospiraceae bacterium]
MKKRLLTAIALSAVMALSACPGAIQSVPDIIPEEPVFDFENGTKSGFFPRGGTEELTVVRGFAHTGEYSLMVSGRTELFHSAEIRIDQFIERDKEYLITAWIYIKTPVPTDIKLLTQIGEGDDMRIDTIFSRNGVRSREWVELQGDFFYGSDADNYISLFIENGEHGGEYYIDDVSVVEIDSGNKLNLNLPALKDVYADYFLFGSAFVPADLSGIRFALIRHHFNAMTAGNAMKPDAMQPNEGMFRFNRMDEMEEILSSFGIVLCGHTLVWHEQSSAWLNKDSEGEPISREQAMQNLIGHIHGVAGHYAGRVIMWDVLNEGMADGPSNPTNWRGALRKSDWYNAFENGADKENDEGGWDYVYLAFVEARKADPNAILYYNDYNLDYQNKSIATAAMVKELNERWLAEGNDRLLIEGIGMQAHYNMGTKPEDVEASIIRFIELGVEISITELDITVEGAKGNESLTPEQEMRQARLFAELMVIYKKYSDHIVRVTVWGLDDSTSWRADRFPLLFNSDLSAKAAYYAMVDPEGFLADPEGTIERINALAG